MLANEAIIDKYHAYFWTCVESNGDPLSFREWYDDVFLPFITGIETQLMAKN